MIRMVASIFALILLAPGYAHAAKVGAPYSCPRPADQYGARYQIMTGVYQSRQKTPGGGTVVTITVDRASPMSVPVTGAVFDATGKVTAGTRVTLVGYVGASASGAQPPFSCIELAP